MKMKVVLMAISLLVIVTAGFSQPACFYFSSYKIKATNTLEIYDGPSLKASFTIGTKNVEYIMAKLINCLSLTSTDKITSTYYDADRLTVLPDNTSQYNGVTFYLYDPAADWKTPVDPTGGSSVKGSIRRLQITTHSYTNPNNSDSVIVQIRTTPWGTGNEYLIYYPVTNGSNLKLDYIVAQLVKYHCRKMDYNQIPQIEASYTIDVNGKAIGTDMNFLGN